MNAINQPPRTPATVSVPCPWCAEPVAVEDIFVAPAIRCPACATLVDLEPAGAITTTIAAAA